MFHFPISYDSKFPIVYSLLFERFASLYQYIDTLERAQSTDKRHTDNIATGDFLDVCRDINTIVNHGYLGFFCESRDKSDVCVIYGNDLITAPEYQSS